MRPGCSPQAGRGNSRKSLFWATPPRNAWRAGSRSHTAQLCLEPRLRPSGSAETWGGISARGSPSPIPLATRHPWERPRPPLGAGPFPVGRPLGCRCPQEATVGGAEPRLPGPHPFESESEATPRSPSARPPGTQGFHSLSSCLGYCLRSIEVVVSFLTPTPIQRPALRPLPPDGPFSALSVSPTPHPTPVPLPAHCSNWGHQL